MSSWLERLTGETRADLLHLLRRSPRTITELADALGLTDNAVRTHIASLERDGIVTHVGTERATGGKPARLYALSTDGEELFPKAYAFVLGGLLEEIAKADGWERATALLSEVGRRAAAAAEHTGDAESRVVSAATAFRQLGGDVEVQPIEQGWQLQGFGCPLAAVSARHPQVCALARALIAEITGLPVTECCERGGRPQCRFRVERNAVSP